MIMSHSLSQSYSFSYSYSYSYSYFVNAEIEALFIFHRCGMAKIVCVYFKEFGAMVIVEPRLLPTFLSTPRGLETVLGVHVNKLR